MCMLGWLCGCLGVGVFEGVWMCGCLGVGVYRCRCLGVGM